MILHALKILHTFISKNNTAYLKNTAFFYKMLLNFIKITDTLKYRC